MTVAARRMRVELWLLPALALLTLLLYAPALRVYFSLDDLLFLANAAGLEPWPDTLHRALSKRGYFSLAWSLFGARPLAFHAVALALHAANGALLYRVARRLGASERAGVHAAVLFVASPVAFTPLHWISASQELLVTLFALAATLAALAGGAVGCVAALAFGAAALLSKENAVLLLPALAVALPLARRERWILGLGGVALAALLLPRVGIGMGESLPPGHPYEIAFGSNAIWNGLTFSAWVVRLFDFFPDREPVPQPQLVLQGLLLPGILVAAAALRRAWRAAIWRGALVGVALLAPALPLVRHSYLYFLYLPLVPLWLLAGAALAELTRRRRPLALGVLVLFVALTGWRGESRRELRVGALPADPMLRWGPVLEASVASLRAAPPRGDILILAPLPTGAAPGASELQVTLELALRGGQALRVFYPAIDSVEIARSRPQAPVPEDRHLYLAHAAGELRYLGVGAEGWRAWNALRREGAAGH